MSRVAPIAGRVRKPRSAPATKAGPAPSVSGMGSFEGLELAGDGRGRRRPPRVPPDHLDRLSDAKYDFQAILRADLTESHILEMFLDEKLEDWIAAKLEELRARPTCKGGKE